MKFEDDKKANKIDDQIEMKIHDEYIAQRNYARKVESDFAETLREKIEQGDKRAEAFVEAIRVGHTKPIAFPTKEEWLEEWSCWVPLEGLACNYWLHSLSEIDGSLYVELSEDRGGQKVKIIFKSIVSYRCTNESFQLDLMNRVMKKYGCTLFRGCSFFKVEHSLYVQWLFEESESSVSTHSMIHFVLETIDEIVEVVGHSNPEVFITEKEGVSCES